MEAYKDDNEDLRRKLTHLRERLGAESLLEEVMKRVDDADPPRRMSTWRILVYDHWRKSAAGATAAIVVGMVTAALLFQKPSAPVYAIEQTLAAIDRMEQSIKTVYFKAELYKQGKMECWMLLDKTSGKPTHMCLWGGFGPVRKICKPEGSFFFNTRTNRVRKVSRDERDKKWYLDFAQFFKRSLKAARDNPRIRIGRERDPRSSKQVVVIRVDEGDRQCTYFIDPKTELPIRFDSTEPKDLKTYLRPTVAVKSMETIEYNKPIPEGLFDIPSDAKTVTNEHDVIIHPGIGLDVTGMAPERACLKIIDEMLVAANNFDFNRLKKLYWPFMVPPKAMVEQIKAKAGGKKPVEKIEVGTPYEKNGYWYVLCVTREFGGKAKRETVPIKFYEFDGRTYCLIAWPD